MLLSEEDSSGDLAFVRAWMASPAEWINLATSYLNIISLLFCEAKFVINMELHLPCRHHSIAGFDQQT